MAVRQRKVRPSPYSNLANAVVWVTSRLSCIGFTFCQRWSNVMALGQVDHPDQIKEIFDAISYAKGASVIRMLAAHLGVDAFMQGQSS